MQSHSSLLYGFFRRQSQLIIAFVLASQPFFASTESGDAEHCGHFMLGIYAIGYQHKERHYTTLLRIRLPFLYTIAVALHGLNTHRSLHCCLLRETHQLFHCVTKAGLPFLELGRRKRGVKGISRLHVFKHVLYGSTRAQESTVLSVGSDARSAILTDCLSRYGQCQ